MANAISGGISLSSSLVQQLDAGPARLQAYPVPIQVTDTETYASGTGANQANKIYQGGGTATAAAVDIDLTTVVCVDGSTGLSHVREVIVFNDATNAAYVLTMGGGTNPFKPYLGGTTPTLGVEAGAPGRFAKPLGTNGWTVDASNKTLRLDPGANTIPYRIIVLGD